MLKKNTSEQAKKKFYKDSETTPMKINDTRQKADETDKIQRESTECDRKSMKDLDCCIFSMNDKNICTLIQAKLGDKSTKLTLTAE